MEQVEVLAHKLDKIEYQMRLIADIKGTTPGDSKVTIDVTKLASEFDISDLEEMQKKIDDTLTIILYEWPRPRVKFHTRFDHEQASAWFDKVSTVIENYKWSKTIPVTEIWEQQLTYWKGIAEVPYKALFDLCRIYNSLSEEDRSSLLNTVSLRFNELFEAKRDDVVPDEEIPF